MRKNLKWTSDMDTRIVELRESGCTFSEAAEIMSKEFEPMTRDSVSSRYRKLRITDAIDDIMNDSEEEELIAFNEAIALLKQTGYIPDTLEKFGALLGGSEIPLDRGLPSGINYDKLANMLGNSFVKQASSEQANAKLFNLDEPLDSSTFLAPDLHEQINETLERAKNTLSKNPDKEFVEDTYETGDRLFPLEVYSPNEDINSTFRIKRELKDIYDLFNDGQPHKILSLSDLHAPFIDFQAVEEALLDHEDADILVLNGDIFDGHSISQFDKTNDFDLYKEIDQVTKLLDVVTKRFDYVVWNSGNHEYARVERMVAKTLPAGLRKFALERLDPRNYVAERYDNVIVAPHFWLQIGEAVFTHPNGYSSALMSTAIKQHEIFKSNKGLLPGKRYGALIQGHTHDMGEYYVGDTKIIEQGCLCHHTMEYKFKNPSKRPWITGYAVVELFSDGSVDHNYTRTYRI